MAGAYMIYDYFEEMPAKWRQRQSRLGDVPIFTSDCSKGQHDKCSCRISCVCRCHATSGQWKNWKDERSNTK